MNDEEYDIVGGQNTGSFGNSMSKRTRSISRHARALCLGVNPRRRDATCSPNELASSCSADSFSILVIISVSRLSPTCCFLLFGGGGLAAGETDLSEEELLLGWGGSSFWGKDKGVLCSRSLDKKFKT